MFILYLLLCSLLVISVSCVDFLANFPSDEWILEIIMVVVLSWWSIQYNVQLGMLGSYGTDLFYSWRHDVDHDINRCFVIEKYSSYESLTNYSVSLSRHGKVNLVGQVLIHFYCVLWWVHTSIICSFGQTEFFLIELEVAVFPCDVYRFTNQVLY